MKQLFEHMTRLDYDEVFNNLSIGHIFVCIAFVIGFIWMFRRSGDILKMPIFEAVEKVMVFVIIGAQGIYYYWYFVLGAGGDPYPLYICRIAGILICLTYFVHIKPLEDFSIMACIYGGIMAVFFSSPKPFAFPHITRWAYFTMHIGMTYVALLRIVHYHRLIGKKELWNALIVNTVAVIGVLITDIVMGWNYMFLMHIQLPDMPVLAALHVPDIINSTPWITCPVAFIGYTFGTYAAWLFASWMSRKALRMGFQVALEQATDV
ncbi:TMEM164 family acyltransferase [Aminicella lysinilytica]|uniref:Putative integral membrane protein (TIGR02206 family) n=1 Tax=Aminicella lysinilytica TaxID=433323 RepID=A0A4V3CRL7_9FIRM|nr:YwaF family protein [Aminicella lysinilytica]TDP56372.1 putative integral membrane protein (TIGR02206 family) [Aminicella lysinilytica]